jgi:hypothetical protein
VAVHYRTVADHLRQVAAALNVTMTWDLELETVRYQGPERIVTLGAFLRDPGAQALPLTIYEAGTALRVTAAGRPPGSCREVVAGARAVRVLPLAAALAASQELDAELIRQVVEDRAHRVVALVRRDLGGLRIHEPTVRYVLTGPAPFLDLLEQELTDVVAHWPAALMGP